MDDVIAGIGTKIRLLRQTLGGAVVTVAAGRDSGKSPLMHPGEELVYMLSGALEFELDETYHLRQGDSLHFRTDRPHRWRNSTARPAKAIWISLQTA